MAYVKKIPGPAVGQLWRLLGGTGVVALADDSGKPAVVALTMRLWEDLSKLLAAALSA